MATMNVEIEVPEWAKYVAQDYSGEWWFYEIEPTPLSLHWAGKVGFRLKCVSTGIKPEDFSAELYELY